MGLIKTWNELYFSLELIVKDKQNLNEGIDPLRARISENYPNFNMWGGHYMGEHYKGRVVGPILQGKTDIQSFRQAFGKNVRRGVSCLFPPGLPIPFDIYFKWYQTGDLTIPENLQDLVKNVSIVRPAIGSWAEWNIIVPPKAKED